MINIDYHVRKQAINGPENECGDTGIIRLGDGYCIMALVDVLGHGMEAFEVAQMAETYLLDTDIKEPSEMINGLHKHIKNTRGAVCTICSLHIETGVMKYSGIGNISGRIMGNNPRRLTGKDGVVGYMMPTPVEYEERLYPKDIIILSSDGIKEHFDMVDYPDILLGCAENITANFVKRLGKQNDDASCIVLRYGI